MQTMSLKPAADVVVRKQDGTPLAAAGEAVELNSYWQRRLNDGDVVLAESEAAAETKPKGK